MAEEAGRGSYLALDNAVGVLTDMRDYVATTGLDRESEQIDVTTLGDNDTERIPGFMSGEVPMEGPVDFAAGGSHEVLGSAVGARGSNSKRTYEYGPQGNVTGDRRYTGESVVLSYSITITPDEAINFTSSARCDGAITRNTF